MSTALEEMRVNYDKTMKLKNIENATNPLLKRRLERNQLDVTGMKRRQLDSGGGENSSEKKKSPSSLKRVFSAPAARTPLTAFYYTSNLKDQSTTSSEFLNSSFA
jgi:hypothetical protein